MVEITYIKVVWYMKVAYFGLLAYSLCKYVIYIYIALVVVSKDIE